MLASPALASPAAVDVVDWGLTPYEEARQRQEALVARRMEGTIDDRLVLTEHPPVFTVGLRKDAQRHLLWSAEERSAAGITVASTNRGGDITYHGPGQLVVYPIVSLAARRDLHAYLRFLEETLIAVLAEFGLPGTRRDGKTGIWIGSRKIAAIGVAVRRWIAYHGFALNVDPDLSHFAGIVPCGIAATDGTVTSLRAETGSAPSMPVVKAAVERHFRQHWQNFLRS